VYTEAQTSEGDSHED